MKIQVCFLNTFTTDHFRGNPTPVCLVPDDITAPSMHAIAREFNQPVTAFISEHFSEPVLPIRYFTSTGEIPACGHATLAAALVVAELTGKTTASFITIEKRIIETCQQGGIVYLQYPRFTTKIYQPHEELLPAMQLDKINIAFFCSELDTLFLELADPLLLRSINPDYSRMMICEPSLKEIVVTSVSDNPRYDFILRSFCPWIGIDEDPVTGSIHSVLAPYWSSKLRKEQLNVYQASERGGELLVKSLSDKVEIGGRGIVILRGTMVAGKE